MAPTAARKRKTPFNPNTNNNEKLKKLEDETKKSDDVHQQMALDTSSLVLPHLPDLVIQKLFQLLPAKPAVRASLVAKQWLHLWSLEVPVLDFDLDDEYDDEGNPWDRDQLIRRAKLFINFLEGCLERYDDHYLCQRESSSTLSLKKFRIHIKSYDFNLISATSLEKWLSFAVERRVKELDISLRPQTRSDDHGHYCMPTQTLLNAKFLTSLNLEYVRLDLQSSSTQNDETMDLCINILPSLKTMSLKAVIFAGRTSIYLLIRGCRWIECLSLTSCSCSSSSHNINGTWWVHVSSSILKSVQLIHCKAVDDVKFYSSTNLESFTLISEKELSIPRQIITVSLDGCYKLKYINISAQHLKSLSISGIRQEIVKGTIDTPNLRTFNFGGYLKPHVISTKAPNLEVAHIALGWDQEDPNSTSTSHWPSNINFPALRDFLANFDCSEVIHLCIDDAATAEAILLFPENFKKTSSPPFPSVKRLFVRNHAGIMYMTELVKLLLDRNHGPIIEAIESDVSRSLRWMTPSGETFTRAEHLLRCLLKELSDYYNRIRA